MILVSFSSDEAASFKDVKKEEDTFRSQGTENPPIMDHTGMVW